MWSSTGVKNKFMQFTAADSTTVGLTGTTAGSFIAVASAVYSAGGVSTLAVSDGVNGAYTQSFYQNNGVDAGCGLHFFPNNAGGSLTITVNPSGSSAVISVAAHEFLGGTLASGSPSSQSSAGTTLTPNAISPPDNDVLVLAAVQVSQGSGTITENAGSEGFTLSNDQETSLISSFVYKIISGAPGSVVHTWSFSPSSGYSAGIAAFKPTAVVGWGGLLAHKSNRLVVPLAPT